MVRKTRFAVCTAFVLASLASQREVALAQEYVAVILGGTGSEGLDASRGRQLGVVSGGNQSRLWSGSGEKYLEFNIYPYGLDGDELLGFDFVSRRNSVYNVKSAKSVPLETSQASWQPTAIRSGQQVGYTVGDTPHALLFSGSAESRLDLNPPGAAASYAWGVGDAQQVGRASIDGMWRAMLWTGSASSAVDLSGGIASSALGCRHGQQVGAVASNPYDNRTNRACLWRGTAASRVDLHPALPEFVWSYCTGTNGYQQVGVGVGTDGVYHALAWSGTAGSAINLQKSLPSDTVYSTANAIDEFGNIVGWATRSDGVPFAVLWKPVPGIIPNKGGNAGSVTVRFLNADPVNSPYLDGAQVKLVTPGQPDIIGQSVTVVNSYFMTATFDLRGSAAGQRDVVITQTDGSTQSISGGFTVEQGGAARIVVSPIGRTVIRSNVSSQFALSFSNTGNVDAILTPVRMTGIPLAATVTPRFKVTNPPSIDGGLLIDWSQPPWSGTPIVTPSADGSTQNVPLIIGNIPAGYTGSIGVDVIVPGAYQFTFGGNAAQPASYIPNIDQIGSCLGSLIGAAFSGIPLLNLEEQAITAISLMYDYASTLPPMLDNDGEGIVFAVSQVMVDIAATAALEAGATAAAPFLIGVSVGLAGLGAYHSCFGGTSSSGSIDVRTAASRDPNAIAGMLGFGTQQWLSASSPDSQTIYFENEATATAPAQTVLIYDKLDMSALDITTISLGTITFGNKVVTPLPDVSPIVGRHEFSGQVDLRPDKNLLVNINASVDTAGLLVWRFTSVHPDGTSPDPEEGFLDPGAEGSVLFTIRPNMGVETGTVVLNRATIVFDSNAPMDTPDWTNALDSNPPESKVAPLKATQTSSKFMVSWPNATDIGSGMKDYTVFVSTDDGAYQPWLTNTTLTKSTFTGVGGHKYAFYSVARDNTGNLEPAPAAPDATTTVKLCPDTITISPNPVPGSLNATGTVTLTARAPAGGAVVALTSSNTAVASVPASVTIAEGDSSATFAVTTTAVSATTSATISATWNGTKKSTMLKVRPISVSTLTFNPKSVRSQGTTTGTITLEAPAAPSDIVVALTSSSPLLTVPASVTISKGSLTGTFAAKAGTAATSTSVTVKATAGGITKSVTVKVLANGVASLSLSPSAVQGGQNSTATIGLDGVATVDTTVALTTSASTVARFVDSLGSPISSVTISAGHQTATVTVATTSVTAKKSVTLKATANALSKSAVLTVSP